MDVGRQPGGQVQPRTFERRGAEHRDGAHRRDGERARPQLRCPDVLERQLQRRRGPAVRQVEPLDQACSLIDDRRERAHHAHDRARQVRRRPRSARPSATTNARPSEQTADELASAHAAPPRRRLCHASRTEVKRPASSRRRRRTGSKHADRRREEPAAAATATLCQVTTRTSPVGKAPARKLTSDEKPARESELAQAQPEDDTELHPRRRRRRAASPASRPAGSRAARCCSASRWRSLAVTEQRARCEQEADQRADDREDERCLRRRRRRLVEQLRLEARMARRSSDRPTRRSSPARTWSTRPGSASTRIRDTWPSACARR